MLKSRTRLGKIKELFETRDGFHAKIARLIVLFEDLRLELHGLAEDEIEPLDSLGAAHRKAYFLRRSSVTLCEFFGAMTELNISPEFKKFKAKSASMGQCDWTSWDWATQVLGEAQQSLKETRNNTGGHFLAKATTLALSNLSPDTVGRLEGVIHRSGKGAGCKFYFAADLAAAAAVGSLAGKEPSEKVDELVTTIVNAVGEASNAMHFLVTNYLWDRFGR